MEYFQLIQTKIKPLLPVDASIASAWTLPSLIIHSFSPTVILTYAFLCMSVFVLLALEFVNWGTMKMGEVKGKTFPIQGKRKVTESSPTRWGQVEIYGM